MHGLLGHRRRHRRHTLLHGMLSKSTRMARAHRHGHGHVAKRRLLLWLHAGRQRSLWWVQRMLL